MLRLRRLRTSLETGLPLNISSVLCACDALERVLPAATESVQRLPASVSQLM